MKAATAQAAKLPTMTAVAVPNQPRGVRPIASFPYRAPCVALRPEATSSGRSGVLSVFGTG